MKRDLLLILGFMVLVVSLLSTQSLAVCPEDPNDNGECDTLYVEIYPDDRILNSDTEQARFTIRVTHDVPDAEVDSIAAFVIPLCYTSTNPSANAEIDPGYNTTDLYAFSACYRSIFRPIHHCKNVVEDNWMWSLAYTGREWDTRMLDRSDQHFWLALFPTGTQDQRFWEGSRVLLATMTFHLDDTTTICIDTCFWQPVSHLAFSRADAVTYIPRHLMPICEPITVVGPPPSFTVCPVNQSHSANGSGFACDFEVSDQGGEVIYVEAGLTGSGLMNVDVEYSTPPTAPVVQGVVVYDIADHCQSGGIITVTAWDNLGQQCNCYFEVVLTNDPPTLSLPESWFALSGYTMILKVPADDANGDAITGTDLVAMWFQADSLQVPTNPPSFDGGNPGTFTWAPAAADTGTWICLFSATDECGDSYARQMSIEVGVPFCGDCTNEGEISVSDVVCLRSYLFRNGLPPDPLCKGDANCNGEVDAGDMVYLINYFFRYGPAPCFECCP
jgi:hypothetical protein